MAMEFRTIARSSSSVSHRHGIQCAESCDYLSDRAVAIGRLWLDLSRCCLAKTALPGEQGSPGKTSRDFERKSEMDERLREFSRSAKFSGMNPSLPAGADYPYHQVTEADVWSDDPRSPNYNRHIVIDPKNPPDNYTP